MKAHVNPYRINDPENIFDVCENSSHPELNDVERVYFFHGHTFRTATELEKYCSNEGIRTNRLTFNPVREKSDWRDRICIYINERIG